MDIDKREYAEIDMDKDDLKRKKAIILLALGSREDVASDLFSEILHLFQR